VARIELSAEVKTIESLIDAKEQGVASTRLQAAHSNLGRRPEYRYLVCLYDSTFRVRSDRELLHEVIELVGEQPDLMEATALLAELYSRTGDEARADLFARLALESPNPSARTRAMEVLKARANDGSAPPPSSHVQARERAEEVGPPSSATAEPRSGERESQIPPDATPLDRWFAQARRELVHRRSPMYGMRSLDSVVEMLLDWGKTVAEGNSFLSPHPLPLTRSSLIEVDEVMLALRRQPGNRSASKSDTSRAMAAAGFFLAVVLHELEANVIEIAPDDGGCKVVLPTGAGTRPLLVAAAFADGSGPGLVQTFDRLAAASELGGGTGPASEPSFRRPTSSGRMAVAKPVSSMPRENSPFQISLTPKAAPGAALDELALTRPEVEAAPVRLLERQTHPADLPPLDLPGIALALAASPLGQDIATRAGTYLLPTPASVEALESYCLVTRGESGSAPDRAVWQPSDEDEELILAWGAFLGETLIAAYGGIWECDPNAPSDPRLFRVISQDRVAAWPITQVYLRLKNGPQHNLIEFFASVGRLLG
jgi:hypothetical protein